MAARPPAVASARGAVKLWDASATVAIGLPSFSSYPSNHATVSSASTTVFGALFPSERHWMLRLPRWPSLVLTGNPLPARLCRRPRAAANDRPLRTGARCGGPQRVCAPVTARSPGCAGGVLSQLLRAWEGSSAWSPARPGTRSHAPSSARRKGARCWFDCPRPVPDSRSCAPSCGEERLE